MWLVINVYIHVYETCLWLVGRRQRIVEGSGTDVVGDVRLWNLLGRICLFAPTKVFNVM